MTIIGITGKIRTEKTLLMMNIATDLFEKQNNLICNFFINPENLYQYYKITNREKLADRLHKKCKVGVKDMKSLFEVLNMGKMSQKSIICLDEMDLFNCPTNLKGDFIKLICQSRLSKIDLIYTTQKIELVDPRIIALTNNLHNCKEVKKISDEEKLLMECIKE